MLLFMLKSLSKFPLYLGCLSLLSLILVCSSSFQTHVIILYSWIYIYPLTCPFPLLEISHYYQTNSLSIQDPQSNQYTHTLSLSFSKTYEARHQFERMPDVSQTAQRKTNRHVPTLPKPEDFELMLPADMNATIRRAIYASLQVFGTIKRFTGGILDFSDDDDDDYFDQTDDEEEWKGSGIQFSPSQVEDFMQTVSRVEMGTLGTDELACSICKEEYSKQRGVDSSD